MHHVSKFHTQGTDIYNDIFIYLHLFIKQFKQRLFSIFMASINDFAYICKISTFKGNVRYSKCNL